MHGPFEAPPAHTIRFSSTPSVWFILSVQLLVWTMGTTVSCSLSVEVSWTPVAPQPESMYNRVKCFHGLTLLTIDSPILVNKAFTKVRKTGRAEDCKIHSLFCEFVVNWIG